MALFKNRLEAGRKLAQALSTYANRADVVVLGLPRGGMSVAFAVANALAAPLDIFLVRKLNVPGRRELAMGAITSGGVRMLNHGIVRTFNIQPEIIEAIAVREQRELQRQTQLYRGNHSEVTVSGRTAILVDDGLTGGAGMRAAVAALRNQHPARIITALPTGQPHICREFEGWVDELVYVEQPRPIHPVWGVRAWYEECAAITQPDDVRRLLAQAPKQSLLAN